MRQRRIPFRPRVELLESRALPSVTSWQNQLAHPYIEAHPLGSGGAGQPAFYPSDIQQAYGINGISGNGSGQTIAIIDAYNDPNIKSDLASFDSSFSLPAPPSFKVVNENGGTRLPRNSPRGSWDIEESLDVEWAHSVAPGASIILVECNSSSYSDLLVHGVNWARKQTGVSVISMSFGGGEFSGETSYDTYFTTPSGHAGDTFVASTGDGGAPGGYPAWSPNVLAVGGTTLTLNTSSNWVSETGWSGSGGGQSTVESEPSYQNGVQSSGKRQTPDVAFDADPNTGVYVLDTYAGGAFQVGGTSLSAPSWAGLIAIANQLRIGNGLGTLNGTQAQSILYGLPASDWHDIVSGNNGFSAGPGYDLVTGIGSPIANLLVPALGSHPGVTQVPSSNTASTGTNGGIGVALGQIVSQNGSLGAVTQNNNNSNAAALSITHLVPNPDSGLIDAMFESVAQQHGVLIGGH
jgi:subtilase family serine protease